MLGTFLNQLRASCSQQTGGRNVSNVRFWGKTGHGLHDYLLTFFSSGVSSKLTTTTLTAEARKNGIRLHDFAGRENNSPRVESVEETTGARSLNDLELFLKKYGTTPRDSGSPRESPNWRPSKESAEPTNVSASARDEPTEQQVPKKQIVG